jgi:hypothetical protein
MERDLPPDAAAGDAADTIRGTGGPTRAAEQAFDALAPMLAHLLADREVSDESAMHVVVMDPAADPRATPFDEAILAERSFGDPSRWEADYAWYARAKARCATAASSSRRAAHRRGTTMRSRRRRSR